ncbi:MAG: PIN domain-containing protein [Candidatus Bathyarchaeia archaeon]
MKNKHATLRILLDTSFILPSLGIDVGEDVSKGLKKIIDIKAEIYYSHFSILESLWIAARLVTSTTFDDESFSLGLRSIIEGDKYIKVEEDSRTFNEALKLYTLGHKDMMDNILYANSTSFNLQLLTLDNKLKEFIHERGLKDTLISPNQITC